MARKSKKRSRSRSATDAGGAVRSNRYTAALQPAFSAVAEGDYTTAEQQFRDVLHRFPQLIDGYVGLAALLEHKERQGEAAACLREAIRIRPKAQRPRIALAQLYRDSGKFSEAVACLEDYLVYEPNDVDARYLLGFSHLGLNQVRQGVEQFRAVLRTDAGHVEALLRLGQALHVLREAAGAERAFRQLVALEPEHGYAWLGLGHVLMRKGDIAQARECFFRAIRIDPTLPDVSTALARSHRYTETDHEEVDFLAKLASRSVVWPDVRADYNFALGKIMDDLHRYDEAFEHYALGNCLAKERKPAFDGVKLVKVVGDIIDTFSSAFFTTHENFGHTTDAPVFVIGMMRSGSTLVEQILASHPDVFGGDELPYIDELAETLSKRLGSSYPKCMAHLQPQTSVELGGEYLRRVRLLHSEAPRIVDKMPGNLFHLGFITCLIPNATIVHCQRDPMDVALSIYFQQFENGHEWAYTFREIALFYHQYQRMMDHWREVLPLSIFDVRYEELIGDQESLTRKLVEHCQLPWSDACLDHTNTERLVGSASNWQVRQPLYKRSLARWKNYEPHLGELKLALGEIASSYTSTVDS